jgi:hypothetical protein
MCRATGCSAAETSLAATPRASGGVYVDGAGQRHPWSVDAGHTLHRAGRPFVPVGGMFCFRYLSEFDAAVPAENEARWNEDLAILEKLRRAGLRDLYVNPVNPATRYPVEVWNRCLQELERQGFRYGLELTDGPRQGMDGFLLESDSWRVERKGNRATMLWEEEFGQRPRLQSVLAVSAKGQAAVLPLEPGGVAILSPAWAAGRDVRLLARIQAPTGFNVPDLWGGYREYEARLRTLLTGMTRGPGLHLVVDPLTNEMNYYVYTAQMVPASPVFRQGFETWLRRRYDGNLKNLARAWGVRGGAAFPKEWSVCARLLPVPVEAGKAGAAQKAQLLDPAGLRCWTVDPSRSRLLEDLRTYRDESVGEYCRRITGVVRESLGDLPVVFKHTGRFMRYLLGHGVGAGVDGIGMEVWGKSRAEMAQTAGPPLALIRHWDRPGWLLVTESAPSSLPEGKPPGYPSRQAMFEHLDSLAAYGARGFYLFALRPLPEQLLPDFCLYHDERQLRWLAEYASELEREGSRRETLTRTPRVRFERADRGPGLRLEGWEKGQGDARFSELSGSTVVVPSFGNPSVNPYE